MPIIEALILKAVFTKVIGAGAAKVAAGAVGKVALAQTAVEVGNAIDSMSDAASASGAVPIDVQGNPPTNIHGNPPTNIHGNPPTDVWGNQPRNVHG